MIVGNLLSRQKLTGRLYFARTGFALVDLGNVELTKAMPKAQRSQLKKMSGGLVRVIHEEPGEVDWRWSVKLNEYANEGLQLLRLATRTAAGFTNSFQIGNADETFLLAYPPGVPFFIGVGLKSVTFSTLTNGTGTVRALTWGTQYLYNADTGYLTVFSAAFVANGGPFLFGEQIWVTYTVETPQAAASSASFNIGTPFFQVAAGVSCWIGFVGLTQFASLHCNATNYVLGTDYTIDLGSGMLTALNHLGDGSHNLTATVSAPNLGFNYYTVLSNLFVRGNAQINLFDQNNEEDPLPTTAPREIIIMPSAEINTNEWPQDDGAKWDSFTVELLSYTAPTVQDRN